MSSPLKPANPIRLKWATYSQHTREFEMSHVIIFFSPVSCSTLQRVLFLFHRYPVDAATPCNPRILPFQRPEDAGRSMPNYWKPVQLPRSNKRLLYHSMPLDSLVAVLPGCTIMFWSNKSGNCQICCRFAFPPIQIWQVSLICPKLITHVSSCSVQVICAPTVGKKLFLCLKQKLWSGCWKALSGLQGNQKFSRNLRNHLNLSRQICKDRGKSSDIK